VPMSRRRDSLPTLAPIGRDAGHPPPRTLAAMTVSDVSVDGVSHAEAGRWLSIQEAAHHLAISERTIYRRADRGQLRRQTLSDGRVEVWVPADAESGEAGIRHDVSPDTVGQERAVLLVDRVSAAVSRQLEALTVELAASRERIEALARENGVLSERSAALERELTAVRQVSDADRDRVAGLERVRDAAMAHAAELEARLEAAAERPPESQPDPFPAPIPPTPNVMPRRWEPRWRRWVRRVMLGA